MAVENLLRGVIVVGVLIIGGITASAVMDDDDDPAQRPAIAASAPAVAGTEIATVSALPAPWSEEEAALAVDMSSDGAGQIEIELPGGFGFKLPTDSMDFDGSDFDIDGVGLYPGATARDMKVRILRKPAADGRRALVTMSFTASDSADKVADWYESEFADAEFTSTRTGNQIAGETSDGKLFSLAVVPADSGSRATIYVRSGDS